MNSESNKDALAGCMKRLVRRSFPAYGVDVEAATVNGETGVWSHGQYGWYPLGKWGIKEYPHTHIVSWKYLPNVPAVAPATLDSASRKDVNAG